MQGTFFMFDALPILIDFEAGHSVEVLAEHKPEVRADGAVIHFGV